VECSSQVEVEVEVDTQLIRRPATELECYRNYHAVLSPGMSFQFFPGGGHIFTDFLGGGEGTK